MGGYGVSKTFIAVDRHGKRRLYAGNHLPSWWIRLSLRLHRWTAIPLVAFRITSAPALASMDKVVEDLDAIAASAEGSVE